MEKKVKIVLLLKIYYFNKRIQL